MRGSSAAKNDLGQPARTCAAGGRARFGRQWAGLPPAQYNGCNLGGFLLRTLPPWANGSLVGGETLRRGGMNTKAKAAEATASELQPDAIAVVGGVRILMVMDQEDHHTKWIRAEFACIRRPPGATGGCRRTNRVRPGLLDP